MNRYLPEIDRLSQMIQSAKYMVIMTGAGISTESGIPDFRSPGGFWERYDPTEFLYHKFLSSRDTRKRYWEMVRDFYDLLDRVRPNPAHYAIADLEVMGYLKALITQNIDSLHQMASTSPQIIIELHGNARKVICIDCDQEYEPSLMREKLNKGELPPECDICQGRLKPSSISFGQSLPIKELERAEMASRASDLFLVLGSSLLVQPASLMPFYAKENGARLVIINLAPTPYDHEAYLLMREKAGLIMPTVLQKIKERIE